jgi:molybdopterin molybdotransferase
MIKIEEALKIILDTVIDLKIERIERKNVFGKVLAEDIFAAMDIPPFDKSAMDGFAVRSEDVAGIRCILKIKENIPAGKVSSYVLQKGECAKIMTGAPLLAGADAVVKIENTNQLSTTEVEILKNIENIEKIEKLENICKQGEDIKKNELVLKKGTIIKAPEIATLACFGKNMVDVYKFPKIAVISTGDEIVDFSETVNIGKIRNTNAPMMISLLENLGCNVDYLGLAKDNEEDLTQVIKKGLNYDILIISGGVSMGDYDLVPQILKNLNSKILFHNVCIKPGKPLLFGTVNNTKIFGVPGNPVSNFTTFYVFLRPLIQKMSGNNSCNIEYINAKISVDIVNKSGRVSFIPAVFNIKDGEYEVSPLKINGSADILACSGCNCFIVLDDTVQKIQKFSQVKVLII